jgi:hypothetical protein
MVCFWLNLAFLGLKNGGPNSLSGILAYFHTKPNFTNKNRDFL